MTGDNDKDNVGVVVAAAMLDITPKITKTIRMWFLFLCLSLLLLAVVAVIVRGGESDDNTKTQA